MAYGICHLSIVPLRADRNDRSEMVSQVLYGERFEIISSKKKWSKIKLAYDKYEGWIDNKQFTSISKEQFQNLNNTKELMSGELVDFVTTGSKELLSIPLGSSLSGCEVLGHSFEGETVSGTSDKNNIIQTASIYLNTPYLWGGKTPFGIDCSGLTQMVYKLNGYKLQRDARDQATQGESLSFIEESEAGDLAFFDNDEGNITHVGIILENNYIIHAHGQVRVDRLDHIGIFNKEKRTHTHNLRVIKRII